MYYTGNKKYSYKKKNFFSSFILFLLFIGLIAGGIYSIISISSNPYSKINKLIKKQEYEKALEKLEKLENTKKFNPLNYYYKGIIYLKTKDFLNSVINLRKANIFLNKKYFSKISLYLGEAYYNLGISYYPYAKYYYIKALELNKTLNNEQKNIIKFRVAKIYTLFGRYKDALKFFTDIKTEYSENIDFLYYYAITLKNLDKVNSAINILMKGEKLTDDLNYKLQFNYLLGKSYLTIKNLNKAEFYFKKIIKIKKDSAFAYYYLGYIYYLKKDKTTAKKFLELALLYKPDLKEAEQLIMKID